MKESKKTDIKEKFKKFGASVIIILLGLMMGSVMFLPGSVSDYTSLMNPNKTGSFNGKIISSSDYFFAYNSCQERYKQFKLPEAFIQNCARQSLKELFVLPKFGEKLGIMSSAESIEKELFESVKERFTQLNQDNRAEDDKLTLEELYLREIRYMPIKNRVQMSSAAQVSSTLISSYPYPKSFEELEDASEMITMDIRYIRFSKIELLKELESRVIISPTEVRQAYEAEAVKPGEKKKPFFERKNSITSRLKSEKKQKLLQEIMDELEKAGDQKSLSEVSARTGVKIVTVKNVKLNALNSVSAPGSAPVNLSLPEFLIKFKPGVKSVTAGPLKDRDYTIYAEASGITIKPGGAPKPENISTAERKGQELADQLIKNIITAEAERGEFFLSNVTTGTN